MPASRADDVAVLAAMLRRTGAIVECAVEGASMGTAAPDGALVRIRCEGMAGVAVGSVVATMIGGRLSVHRIVHIGRSRSARGWLITHGDANLTCDAPLPEAAVVGQVVSVRVGEDDWRMVPPAAKLPVLRSLITGAVQRTISLLLDFSPHAAQRAKGLVVLAMAPRVLLRPYDPSRTPAASLAHRDPH